MTPRKHIIETRPVDQRTGDLIGKVALLQGIELTATKLGRVGAQEANQAIDAYARSVANRYPELSPEEKEGIVRVQKRIGREALSSGGCLVRIEYPRITPEGYDELWDVIGVLCDNDTLRQMIFPEE